MSSQVTAFVTLDQAQIIVATSDLSDRGAWAPDAQYEPRDAVLFDSAYYQCLLTNIDKPPTTSPDEWQLLIYTVSGSAAHTADEAYALAEAAYGVAVTGTNGIASAEAIAFQALTSAWDGTNAANIALDTAASAFVIAQDAGDLAYFALQTAWSGTQGANSAFAVAVAGTNAARDAHDFAYHALQTAWSGTAGANSAFSVAVAGTNIAIHADNQSKLALETAWSGTQGANYAASVAVAGTNIGVAGTNAAQQARAVADKALLTAWSGTNGANAALTIAVAGTNAAHGSCGFSFVIDGQGAVITTGLKGYIEVPFGMWVTRWTMVADQAGTAVVDVLKSSGYAGFPTVPSMAGSSRPTLSNAQKNEDTNLFGWTRQISAGDLIGFNVNTAGTVQVMTVAVAGTKS